MAKIYRRIGIRRDNNFSDLSDRKEALNNLLDKLVDTGGTFISEDLDSIRGLFSTGLSASEYRSFGGSTVKETDINGSNSSVVPAITYQNRLDKFKVISGEFSRLNGGSGLTANYFNSDQVKDLTIQNIFVGVTTGPTIPSDTFWESGNFVYSRKINQQSINAAGGVQWDGYFVPTQTGRYSFNTSSSLGFTAEFEKDGYSGSGIGTFTNFVRVGLSTVINTTNANVSSVATNATNEQVTITGTGAVAMAAGIGIGMTVITSTPARVVLGSKVTGVTTTATTTVITFENEDTDPIVSDGAVVVGLGRPAGTSVSKSYTTQTLEKYRPYKIRYRFFVPEGVNPAGLVKQFTTTFTQPGSTGTFLRYNNLYPLDYNFTDDVKGTFNTFLDQSVLFGGNKTDGTETIGSTTNSNGYVRISTNKKVDIKYTPKTALTQIERATSNSSWTAGSKVLSISDTTGIEIGNYVFATSGLTANVNTPVRVVDIVINEFIIIDVPATNTRTNTALTFVEHRGFVKRVTASGSGGNISISNSDTTPVTLGLRSNQVAIWGGNQTSAAYTGITTTGANNTATIFPSQTFTSRRVYFYESRGLIDKALATFCVPAETQCFIVTSNVVAGATILPVNSTSNIQFGYKIQGFSFADGTTVSAKTTNSITLSTPTIKNIAKDSNFTATSSSDDKSLCCPPTDTSPPFEPTEAGLESTVAEPNVKFTGGNLVFESLLVTTPSSNITALTAGAATPSNNTIPINGGDGVTYNLFCV